MGLLNSLLNAGARKFANAVTDRVVAKVADDVAGNMADKVEDAIGVKKSMDASGRTGVERLGEATVKAAEELQDVAVGIKLTNILAEQFPSYTVRANVSPTTIGGTGQFLPYSLGVYSGETPKLFIMIVGHNTCGSKKYRWSKEQARKAGVNMINFVEHYPNENDYIVNRLRQYL